ncbi:uncharacterized protein simc1 isoform X2 [Betta splendens]|uniref:Uncharacterized protein simc1 isoform X2 n=1 Tax=Betta splendens TaxID=158456 RepID=A0A6P7NL48_BETSP|nr:uncharacterized protein simc1 isoform X2 [Betta splendens]
MTNRRPVTLLLRYIDLTDAKWTLPELKMRKRRHSAALLVVDLTENHLKNWPEQETENLPPCEDTKHKSSSVDIVVLAPQQDCGNPKPHLRGLGFHSGDQKKINEAHDAHDRLGRISPVLHTQFQDLEASQRSVLLTKDCTQMSLCFTEANNNSREAEHINNSGMTALNGPHMEINESHPKMAELPGQVEEQNISEFTSANLLIKKSIWSPADSPHFASEPSTCEDKTVDFCSSISTLLPTSPLPQCEAGGEVVTSNTHQMELDKIDMRQCYSDISSPSSHSTQPNSNWKPCDLRSPSPSRDVCLSYKSQTDPIFTPEHELKAADGASTSPESLHGTAPSESAVFVPKSGDLGEGCGSEAYGGDLGMDSPVSFFWQEESDREDMSEDSQLDKRAASTEDRHFVCPVTLQKLMSRPAPSLINVEYEGFGAPEVLCHQSLSLVYSTIDENYTEGTLQLLSDLLQPGYYPPRKITTHLLHGILLDPQCPYHLCEQAFKLLMRTQRHHIADKTTVPWNWELLTSLMAKQDHEEKHGGEVVCMFLEYVVQTLWDDFEAKRSLNALHQSIAKATLSCDQKFHQVRDVIKWLFAAIVKSTASGESMAKEKDEQIRMVSLFQRMLSVSLEVDRSPTLSSAKLSQELFHMLISNVSLRAHRMMLLESLQSKLLRCKLLEHLLDYACPLKIPLPMSLSLLLHFLKNCTLAPDLMDGTERWQRWEELVHLLWMLLFSYNKAMKGYLCSSVSEQSGRVGMLVYRADDKVSRSAICEAVEAFLSRSQADLGQALPLHVEESLTYLQDQLLDVCQC